MRYVYATLLLCRSLHITKFAHYHITNYKLTHYLK